MANGRVKICYAKIDTEYTKKINATSLRGFLGYLFINDPEFHHHSESSFHYPLVQYKIIDKKLCVIGLNEYADRVFYNISQLDHITLINEKIKITNIEMNIKKIDIKNEERSYRFLSPWIALNKKNYDIYKNSDRNFRKQFLERIFVGNVLSSLKGLNIFVDFKIEASIQKFRPVQIVVHENNFIGFYVIVKTNILLPLYIGIGKSVSKGFGTISGDNI